MTEIEPPVTYMPAHYPRAFNVGVVDDDYKLEPYEPAVAELHPAGSMESYEETGKRDAMAIIRKGGEILAYFTLSELEQFVKVLKGSE